MVAAGSMAAPVSVSRDKYSSFDALCGSADMPFHVWQLQTGLKRWHRGIFPFFNTALPSLNARRLDRLSSSAQWDGPGEERGSAPMAVKGETDPAARAHIHPTSSRKPAVVGATLRVGGASNKMFFISSSSSSRTWAVYQNACVISNSY